ncbi:unnamed protein product [Caenorhabditis auriculariae]|uniref:Receptor L-domain domain-containing protein n=1 Tax=Caenorhabditis auriculariae TaxID=2777116 RepID=A0A8S1GZZ6_9PELO|nr:unnamed protein product [Caenorhabditis auriculariae]
MILSFQSLIWCLLSSLLYAFNPCLYDDSACLPLEDFQENCSCILVDKKFNDSGEFSMFFDGYPVPFYYFKQVEVEQLYRDKLSIRLPKENIFPDHSDLSENIYGNLEVEENLILFTANCSMTSLIVEKLIEEGFIRTSMLKNSSNRWCQEGECNAFVYESGVFNKTEGVYSHVADVLQVIEFKGRSIFAVSNAYGKFDVPKVHQMICTNRCKLFYYSERTVCLSQCVQGLRYDHIAVTGDLKRNFDFFIRAAALSNLRQKYSRYIF